MTATVTMVWKSIFENEVNRQIYLNMKNDTQIVLQGNDSEDYVAEG